MELLEKGMKKSVAGVTVPEDLDKEKVIALFKESNDDALEKFKALTTLVKAFDPMLVPIVNSCLAHDYLSKVHDIPETVFKAALAENEVFTDPEFTTYF
jgi:hypothetical protein